MANESKIDRNIRNACNELVDEINKELRNTKSNSLRKTKSSANHEINSRIDNQKINAIKKSITKKYKLNSIPTNIQILINADESKITKEIKKIFITKPTRTISGVAVIAVMSKPGKCPHGKCIFCPGGINSEFGDVPQSYTGKEPATLRGIRNDYDPYLQIFNRLEQYVVLGQNPEKVELIIMGGTFLNFDKKYKDNFIMNCFKAMNDFADEFYKKDKNKTFDIDKFKEFFELKLSVKDDARTKRIHSKILKLKNKNIKSLQWEQQKNDDPITEKNKKRFNTKIKCVGMTLETRPDKGNLIDGNELLNYGCTRIELGIQTVYDDILKIVERGHTAKESIASIQTLKDLGFKLNFHMMPGLPDKKMKRISVKKDIASLNQIFSDSNYRPDMLKVYPCMVMKGTKLYDAYKKGIFKPLLTKEAAEIIVEFKKHVPKYCRIMRVQRDIPTYATESGVDKTNLRQYVDALITEKNKNNKHKKIKCNCIRCREIKSHEFDANKTKFEIIKYTASHGKEYFISLITPDNYLVGFCRMRFPEESLRKEIIDKNKSALIRELHVYGSATSLGKSEKNSSQHKGFGEILLKKAEEIAINHGKKKMIIISGVGVRNYYRKFKYELEGPYMSKYLVKKI